MWIASRLEDLKSMRTSREFGAIDTQFFGIDSGRIWPDTARFGWRSRRNSNPRLQIRNLVLYPTELRDYIIRAFSVSALPYPSDPCWNRTSELAA